MNKKRVFILIGFVLFSMSGFCKEKLQWENLEVGMEYSQEECEQLVSAENSELEKIEAKTLTRILNIYYKTSEKGNGSQKILILSTPAIPELGGTFQGFCINSLYADISSCIFIDERKCCIAGKNREGNTYLLYSGFKMDKFIEKDVGKLCPASGGFFLKDFYFWDSESKYIFMLRVTENNDSIVAYNNQIQFENPKFITMPLASRPNTNYLFVTEVDQKQEPVTGDYYFVPDLKLVQMPGSLK